MAFHFYVILNLAIRVGILAYVYWPGKKTQIMVALVLPLSCVAVAYRYSVSRAQGKWKNGSVVIDVAGKPANASVD